MSKYEVVRVEFLEESERALKLAMLEVDGEPIHWIPKSVVDGHEDNGRLVEGEKLDLDVEGWWLEREGLL